MARQAPFPTREQILEFIRASEGKISKREIARAFAIRGQDRVLLKQTLAEMRDEGLIAKDLGRALRPADELPRVTVIEITGTDEYGDIAARPQHWECEAEPPRIFITPTRRSRLPALGPGNLVLARLAKAKDQDGLYYAADVIRVLERAPRTVLGVFRRDAGADGGGTISPTDRKLRYDFVVGRTDTEGARHGELVLAEVIRERGRRPLGLRRARIVECLGDLTEPRSVSLIAIHHHGIPFEFPEEVLKAAEQAQAPGLKGRDDLREVPLVTIDPSDARDHDDAIFAAPSTDPKNEGGFELIVAIADVAHFVRPGGAIDREARKRGNSCYFPDRHVPMLPDRLSGGLCSLHAGEERAAMVCRMTIDAEGDLLSHRFSRAIMRSAAALTYHEVQEAAEGRPNEATGPLVGGVIEPLYAAWRALDAARLRRHPLELEMPERRIVLGEDGHIESIDRRERLDSHRVVEEFMIAANVAAAETLERRHTPCMYRVHEEPADDKLEALADFLDGLGLKLARGEVMRPELFNRVLARANETDFAELVNDLVLRSQTQAYYSPDNRGHFGLALPRYAHFTSPIRRYSDLVVHRALIRALGLGAAPAKDGLTDAEIGELDAIGEEISATERRAMAAERESIDRYLAAYLSDRVGDVFSGRISGVQRFGLFVALEPSGADGIIPASTIGDDFYVYEEAHHRLVGRHTGRVYQLGQRVEVRLAEADRYTGGLRLELLSAESLPKALMRPARRKGRQKGPQNNRGRPSPRGKRSGRRR